MSNSQHIHLHHYGKIRTKRDDHTRCVDCGSDKTYTIKSRKTGFTLFYWFIATENPLTWRCRSCHGKIYARMNRQKMRLYHQLPRVKARKKLYTERNKSRIAAYRKLPRVRARKKELRNLYKDKIKAQKRNDDKRYYARHKERISIRSKEYYRKNKERLDLRAAEYSKRKKLKQQASAAAERLNLDTFIATTTTIPSSEQQANEINREGEIINNK